MSGTHEHKLLPVRSTSESPNPPAVEHAEVETEVAPVAVPGIAVARSAPGSKDPLGGTAVPAEVQATLSRRRGGGAQLPAPVARSMGELMGADFSGVRVHSDGEADQVSRSVQAEAFTYGSDIYFSRGTYAPGSQNGQRLLAHELAHVAQGQGGGGGGGSGAVVGRADDPAERSADQVADGVMTALRTQAGRVERPDEPRPATDLGALQRQATRVEPATVRRLWKWLFGGGKSSTPAPKAPAVSGPVISAGGAASSVGLAAAAAAAKAPGAAASTATPTAAPAPTVTAPPTATDTPAPTVTAPPTATDTPTPTVTTPPTATDTPVPPTATATPDAASKPPTATATPDAASKPPTATATADAAVKPPTETPANASATADTATPPVQAPAAPPKSAKATFEEAIKPGTAPASPAEARGRMVELRKLLATMSVADRETIYKDRALLTKSRTFVGAMEYMSLLAALGMQVARTKPSKNPAKGPKGSHLTGAQADEKIAEFVKDYPHIKPYLDAASKAGKKGDGFVATLAKEDWDLVYAVEFPKEKIGEEDEQTTNAFASTKNADEPAILHADRGTPSTAIHESMHRYAPNNVLDEYGFDVNEGMTEYFTRMLSDRYANPANKGGKSRSNYQANYVFICDMLPILGDDKVTRETVLAEIYFKGKVDELQNKFTAKWKATKKSLSAKDLNNKWSKFKTAIEDGEWADARALLPKK